MDETVTRSAARVAVGIAAQVAPELRDAAAPRLRARVRDVARAGDHATSLTNRLIANLLRAAGRR
jgi:hypothetical protein